jgi:two-component system sensor histidine kinase TctE
MSSTQDAAAPKAVPTGDTLADTDFAPPSEEAIQRSLFGELLDWMLIPLLLLWPISIAFTYLMAKSIANQPFDHALEDAVTVLAQQIKESNGKIVLPPSSPALDVLHADDTDSVYFQVLGPQGEFVAGDRDMPAPPPMEDKSQTGTVQFRDDSMHGAEVRVAYTFVEPHKAQGSSATAQELRPVLVQIGETLDKRARLANEIIKGVILPQFAILPLALALVWLALSRGLSPLAELQKRIRARKPDDLSPIEAGQVPEEISPLVGSLNDLLERLSHSIEAQKRFIADAAHQMKTPLAGLRTQSELALRQTEREEIHLSLLQLAKSSESATRLVNQLLALARAEHQGPAAKPFVPVDLNGLARDVVHDWVQASFAHQIDLGFEQPEQAVTVLGNPLTLRELLGNLIDNALRYTPTGGTVTVRVRSDPERTQAILEVEDNGPGIPPAERVRIFERFYRVLGSDAEGSGLGLAIVREVAQQHGAEVDVFANPHCLDPKRPGCLFRVTLPLQQEAP